MSEKNNISNETAAFSAIFSVLERSSPFIANAMKKELDDQRSTLKMIASENYSSLAVQLAMGNYLTDKYAEGVPGRRFYAGCSNIDTIESHAASTACSLFNSEYAYVQPHSGADANLIAFWSILVDKVQNKAVENLAKKNINALSDDEYEAVRQQLVNQTIMGMELSAGGHLTHGYRHNISAKMMRAVSYGLDEKTHMLNYAEIERIAMKEKPLILVAGYSAYSRKINFATMKSIADKCGAVLLCDMAHFSGLVAGGVFQGEYSPIGYADVITSTTHKTLRGPRGGIILATKEYGETIDKGCPLVMGGPLPHVMAAKAIAFEEASTPGFSSYAHKVVKNAQALAEALIEKGVHVVTNGTENHIIVFSTEKFGLTGMQAEKVLRAVGITSNRNTVPFDPKGAWFTSGIRIGTPALTTRGFEEHEMKLIASFIVNVLSKAVSVADSKSEVVIDSQSTESAKSQIQEMLANHPLYPEIHI